MLKELKCKDSIIEASLDSVGTQKVNAKVINQKKEFKFNSRFNEDRAKDTLKRIQQLIIYENLSRDRNDLENLIVYFKKKLTHKRNDLDLTIGLGNCLEKLQKIEVLKELYFKFDERIIGSEIIKKKFADILYQEENFKDAVKNYKFCLKKSKYKNNKDIYVKISYCFYNLKNYEKSSYYVLKCLKYFNDLSPEILLLFGNIFLKSKKYEHAIEQYLYGIKKIDQYSIKINDLAHYSATKNKIYKETFLEAVKFSSPTFLLPKFLNNLGNTYNKVGEYSKARKYLIKAVAMENNPYILNNLAQALKGKGNNKRAIYYLLKATKIETQSTKIYFNLAEAFLAQGDLKNAKIFLNKTTDLDQSHQGAKFKKQIIEGNFKGKIPRTYLKKHFDDYSETFDNHLLNNLSYKVPFVFSKLIKFNYDDNYSFNNILDLGCGTGLCGSQIKNNFKNLIGVDISKQMLIKAKEKSIYTKLKCCDIIQFLKKPCRRFELILAGDVFIYFGDLRDIFRLCFDVMHENGRFIFSIEETKSGRFKATQTGRYAHNLNYIKEVVQDNHLKLEMYQDINIRKEHNKFVKGKIVSVIKKSVL